jgi:hypothetical protein
MDHNHESDHMSYKSGLPIEQVDESQLDYKYNMPVDGGATYSGQMKMNVQSQ